MDSQPNPQRSHATLADYADFRDVFGSNTDLEFYEAGIRENRNRLEGELFVDRLLGTIGIGDPSQVYPPGSVLDLEELHEQIVTSDSPDHYQKSLIYYLLRDLKPSLKGRAATFAEDTYLPKKYRVFIDGLWYMDRLSFEKALNFLTEPVLDPTYSEDILYTLCQHAPEDDNTLPLAYYHTVSVTFTESATLEAFFTILCRSSIVEAFFYSRSRVKQTHRGLFEQLVDFVLTQSEGSLRGSRSAELVTLPLDEAEESWLEGYLTKGEGRRSQGAADTLIMRAMATGRFDAVQEQSELSRDRKINGITWARLMDSMDQASNQNGIAT